MPTFDAKSVLIGPVPLFVVQKLTISEGYKVVRIEKSQFYQALAPALKTITIEASLSGPERSSVKKSLEIVALTSRLLVAGVASLARYTGVPVVSGGLTISLNMMITDLKFVQGVDKPETIDATITLQEIPRRREVSIFGEAADVVLAGGSAAIPTSPPPGSSERKPGT